VLERFGRMPAGSQLQVSQGGGSQTTAVITSSWLNKKLFEWSISQDSMIGNAVKRNSARQTEIA
jgi:hypothetical protein